MVYQLRNHCLTMEKMTMYQKLKNYCKRLKINCSFIKLRLELRMKCDNDNIKILMVDWKNITLLPMHIKAKSKYEVFQRN